MDDCVLDSSALIAYIFEEKYGENVAEYLSNPFISSVNYSEVVSFVFKRGYGLDFLEDLEIEIVDFDKEQAEMSAELSSITKKFGLSLGDRACLALAISKKIPVVTADKIWSKLDVGVKIKLIR